MIFLFLHVGHFKFNKFWTVKEYETDVSGIALGVTGGAAAATESAQEAHSQMRDLYRLVSEEFHNPVVVILYLLAMIALGLHLNHAIFSATQTLGANNKRYEKAIWFAGRAFTFVVAGGFFLLADFDVFASQSVRCSHEIGFQSSIRPHFGKVGAS